MSWGASQLTGNRSILVDSTVFIGIGTPSNPKYQAFRREVKRAEAVLKLPERVVGELGGREAVPIQSALEDEWVEIIEAPPIRDGDAVNASDIARRTMAAVTDRPEHKIEKTDTILAGLAIQYLLVKNYDLVTVITDDKPAKRGIETAVHAQGYGDSITVISRYDVIDKDPGSLRPY